MKHCEDCGKLLERKLWENDDVKTCVPCLIKHFDDKNNLNTCSFCGGKLNSSFCKNCGSNHDQLANELEESFFAYYSEQTGRKF